MKMFYRVGAAAAVLVIAASAAHAAEPERRYNLKAEDLETALHEVALISGRSVLAPTQLVADHQSPPLSGTYTAEAAVRALLTGTGLKVAVVGDALVVSTAGAEPAAPPPAQLSEVVVSASRIRGAPPAAPVQTITRTDIDRSGYGEIGDLVRSLPEAYGGGPNPGVLTGANATNPSNQNQTGASTINLRGLGSDATLVMVDGHRLPDDSELEAADISGIPLAAIQRVEVVTDGSSALYGADAVAGVVNFVMRSDYDGAELSERIGGATEGGDVSQSYTALGGKTWDGGHLLVSAEYQHDDPILAGQRSYTSGAYALNSLIQADTQTSAFASFGQDLTPWASLHLDGLYSQRAVGGLDQLTTGGTIYTLGTGVRTYFLAPSLDLTLPGGWTADLQGTIGGSHDRLIDRYTGYLSRDDVINNSREAQASANGPLFSLPGGPLKLAVGAGYRVEDFALIGSDGLDLPDSRNVTYAFGELLAPIVQPSSSRFLLNALDLSLAGRWERYSDFGVTANPKVGLRYRPTRDLVLRGTWGKSFKAPDFIEMIVPTSVYLFPVAALGGSGSGTALVPYGGNPDLKPEKATSLTVGLDWTPTAISGLKVSATYFDIDYTDRIVQPITSLGTALSNPAFSPFITDDPTPAEQAAAIAESPIFYNLTGAPYSASNVIALIDDRLSNAAAQRIDGVDLSVTKAFHLGPDDALDAFVNATWLHIVQQDAAGGPWQTISGTLFNPPNLKVRSGLTWTHGPLAATTIVNYISGETDTGVEPAVPIGSWTTLDLNLTYAFGRVGRWLPDLQAQLSVTNAFDAHPPYARGAGVQAPGYDFDSTNASAIGRFVAFTLRERL